LWDAATGKELTSLGYAQGVRLYSAAFSPNGRQVLTASYDGLASVWSATLSAPLATIERVVVDRVDGAIPPSELQAEQSQVGG
jgi:WD40 repeat protein